jgi:hypothetical protein
MASPVLSPAGTRGPRGERVDIAGLRFLVTDDVELLAHEVEFLCGGDDDPMHRVAALHLGDEHRRRNDQLTRRIERVCNAKKFNFFAAGQGFDPRLCIYDASVL